MLRTVYTVQYQMRQWLVDANLTDLYHAQLGPDFPRTHGSLDAPQVIPTGACARADTGVCYQAVTFRNEWS